MMDKDAAADIRLIKHTPLRYTKLTKSSTKIAYPKKLLVIAKNKKGKDSYEQPMIPKDG
jgi:hypothetical protein